MNENKLTYTNTGKRDERDGCERKRERDGCGPLDQI